MRHFLFNSFFGLFVLFVGAQQIQAQCTFSLSATVTSPSCFGGNNGLIDLTVLGGNPPFNFEWSNGVQDQDLMDLSSGTYTVTVTDGLGCAQPFTKAVSQPALLSVGISGNNIDCWFAYFSGTPSYSTDLTATPTGGTPPYFYNWSNNGNGNVHTVSQAGTYTVTVIDGNSCTASAQRVVLMDTIAPAADAGLDVNLSCQISQVSIGGSGSASGANITYSWTGPGITTGAGGNKNLRYPVVKLPGTYTLEVHSEVNGCSGQDVVVVGGTPAPIADAGLDTGIPCGGNQLSLDGSASSSGPGFIYQWSTLDGNIVAGAISLSPIVNQPGTYKLIVTNTQNGCTSSDSVKVYPGPAISSQEIHVLDVSCTGQLGIASVTMAQGTGPYTYEWSNGGTNSALINILQGVYQITTTDATGCKYYGEATVSDTSTLSLSAQLTNPTCGVSNNGAINLTAIGQYGPPSAFAWNTGESTEDLNGLIAGTYTVTVTYALGSCTQTYSATLADSSGVMLSTVVTDASTCAGTNGFIDLTVTGGTGPFTYDWSDGGSTQDKFIAPNLIGNYTVWVKDVFGCVTSTTVLVNDAPDLTLSTSVIPDECGANGGIVVLTENGGLGPYTYVWSTGSTQKNILNLTQGDYTVTVTDVVGCTATTSATIIQTSGITITGTVTNVGCNGSNGSIDISVSGGIQPYTYIWSPGNTTQDISGLGINTYTVTVTTAGSCTQAASFTVGQATASTTLSLAVTDDDCTGNCTGSIDLTVIGGVLPFTYAWSPGNTSQDISNVCAITYTVTVTEGNGCTKTVSTLVGKQSSGIVLTAVPTAASCGLNNGAISLTVNNGTGPFQYLWSDGGTTQNRTAVLAGTYTVTVSDGSGCTQTTSASIGQISNLIATTNVTDASCAGNDGSIDLTINGGSGPFTFLWENNATTEDIGMLGAGNYNVTITDITGCTQTSNATVGQLAVFTLDGIVSPSTSCGLPNGQIDITVTPAGSYFYLWSDGSTTEDPSSFPPGDHTVTVSDGSACTAVKTFNVADSPNRPIASALPTGTTCDLSNGGIMVQVTGGVMPYTYLWSDGETTKDLTFLLSGTYTLTVTGANACTDVISVNVSNSNLTFSLSGTVTPNSSCLNPNGAIDLTVTPAGSYNYFWSNGLIAQNLIGVASGAYTVTVSAGGSCTSTASYFVPDNANSPVVMINSVLNNCTSETITAPDQAGFSYLWIGPNGFNATQAAITVNVSGTYAVTVTEVNGCTGTNDYTVNLMGGGACGYLKGRVFHDENESCSPDAGEPGLAGWIVRAEGATDTLYGVTDAQGRYLVGVSVGTYTMKVLVPNGLWSICPGNTAVTLTMAGDTIAAGDFPVQSIYFCPALTVSIGTDKLRRCFLNNFYEVEYCNKGTQKATDAFVTVVLDQYLTLMSASVPYTDLGANSLKVDLGDLEVGECGTFSIQVFVNCNAQIGQTHCTQATIYPDTLCAPTNPNWSGASLSIQSVCNSDSLRFTIRNDGKATMSNSSNYIVVEDGIMFRSGVLPLLAENESMELAFPANGSTWRVEVGQELFHPYPAPVGLSVEACTTSPSFSTGFLNQFPAPDEPTSVDIDCTTNKGSFDPNDKHGYPVGYGAEHYIRPGTDLEYLVRFQNTGTDTAFTVQIIDTLSTWLDPATIRFGASSHPYRYDLTGEGVVHLYFENILLPDSSTNEVASNGFAKFLLKPRLDAPLESLIENTAAIYFDFNDPVYTNTTYHRLGLDFITVGLWQPVVPSAEVSAVPNPFIAETILTVKGLRKQGALHLQVFDLAGNLIREMDTEDEVFHLRKGDWQTGLYLFKITQNGQLVGTGKLVAE